MPSLLKGERAIVGLAFFLAPFVTLIAPLSTVIAFLLVAMALITLALVHGRSLRELFRFDLGLALFAVAAAYLLLTAAWSLDPPYAVNKAVWFALVAVLAYGAARAILGWNPQQTKIAATAFLLGLLAGAAFVLIQLITEQALTRFLLNAFPEMRPERLKGIKVEDGRVVDLSAFELNRNVAVMLMAFWPALLCLTRLPDLRWRRLAMVALCLAMAGAAMLSAHETSMIGLVVSVVVFLAARFWPVGARRATLAAWCLAFVLIVPLAALAFKAHLHEAGWLPFSAQERVVLWAYRADKIADNPLLGVGLGSSHKLAKTEKKSALTGTPEESDLRWKPGWHAHNAFMETWFELGAIGVVLLLAAGCAVIGAIARLNASAQPFILAQFAAYFVILGFGWGLWQSWLMALPGLAAIYAALAARSATLAERA